jgi:PAS domain S-box-containing protein
MSAYNHNLNFKKILDMVLDGIWIINSNAETVYINQSLADNFGYRTGDMIGKSFYEFMDTENRDLAKTYFKRRKEGISEEHDIEFLNK